MLSLPRRLATAVCLSAMTALAVAPALAGGNTAGSKNFSPPASAPNYFANESGPTIGGKADSRVVDPPSVSAIVPPPPQSLRAAAAYVVVPARHAAAKTHGRVHHASARHGRSAGRHVAVRGRRHSHVAAARSAHAVAKAGAKHRPS